MAIAFLRDLRGLKILLIHPPDKEGDSFMDHLRRIGCLVTFLWPVPHELPPATEVVFLTIEDEYRPDIELFLKSMPSPKPTLLAILSYENPSTLQLVLQSEALAVLSRPIQPFGLLASLAIARSVWLEREGNLKELQKLKRKTLNDKRMVQAKAIIMSSKGLSEEQAHSFIRGQAMSKRISMEQVANAIIHAEDLLRA